MSRADRGGDGSRPVESRGDRTIGEPAPSRRRGVILEKAIRAAALDELSDHSFAGFSMERVAMRAGTGKAALYRRWPTKLALVVDTVAGAFPNPEPLVTTGNTRRDLLRFHQQMAADLGGSAGAALRANVGQHLEHPELAAALRDRIIEPRHRNLEALLRAGVTRGEVRPEAITPVCVEAGPSLLRQHFIEHGAPISDRFVKHLVDDVLMPMLQP